MPGVLSRALSWTAPLIAVLFCLQPNASAAPKEPREVFKLLVENVSSKEDVLNLLGHARASNESQQAIKAELDKRWPKNFKLPKMTVKNDQIYIAGQPSGIHILNCEKGELKIGKKTWNYNPDKTPDVNYLSLVQFFERAHKTEQASALGGLLFPPAKAQITLSPTWSGAILGGLFGGLAGLGVAWFTGGSYLVDGLAAGGMGAIFGAVLGSQYPQNAPASSCGVYPNGLPIPCTVH